MDPDLAALPLDAPSSTSSPVGAVAGVLGAAVADAIALEIPDNVEVGRRDPMALVEIYRRLKLDGADAVVLSSCVQMPSLAAIPVVEQECGLPVVSAAVCTTYQMLKKLDLATQVPDAGGLLSGAH